MKMLGFKLLAFIVIVLVAPMFISGPNGKPIMSIDDWIPQNIGAKVGGFFNSLGNVVESGADVLDSNAILGAGSQIYTWRDEHGTLHYSDTAIKGAQTTSIPENNSAIPAQTVRLNVASVRKKNAFLLEESGSNKHKKSASKSSANSLEGLNAVLDGDYSKAPELMKNLPALIEQAKQARQVEH